MVNGTMTVPGIRPGARFLCAGRYMKRYTKKETELPCKKSIVRSVNENGLTRTEECRGNFSRNRKRIRGSVACSGLPPREGQQQKSAGSDKRHMNPLSYPTVIHLSPKHPVDVIDAHAEFSRKRLLSEEHRKIAGISV